MTDALDERATSGNEQELLKAAACDITTGWGVDSLFEFQLFDPCKGGRWFQNDLTT